MKIYFAGNTGGGNIGYVRERMLRDRVKNRLFSFYYHGTRGSEQNKWGVWKDTNTSYNNQDKEEK